MPLANPPHERRDQARKQLIDLIDQVTQRMCVLHAARARAASLAPPLPCKGRPPAHAAAPPASGARGPPPPPTLQKRGKKALLIDPSLSGPLSLLDPAMPELLAEHGVVK